VVGRVLIITLIFDAILILLFRTRWRPGIDAVRRFNKKFLNPMMMRFAGADHWYASVVHHEGRKSGKAYTTPIWAVAADSHFYIPLPYGTDVDWCQNILQAGHCVLESHGERYETTSPEIVTADIAAAHVPWRDHLRFSVYGVDSYLRLELRADGITELSA
jgi:hypothetical protein